MVDVDTVARRAAQDLHAAAASLPVPQLVRSTRRTVPALALAVSVVVLVVAVVLIRPAERDVRVATSPLAPSFLIDESPVGEAGTITSGRVADSRWRLFIDGPSNELCLAVTISDPAIEPSVCLGGPGGAPATDPFQPLVMDDKRAPRLIGGRVPDETTRVLIELHDGRALEARGFARTPLGAFFVHPLGEEVAIATRAVDGAGTDLRRFVVSPAGGERPTASDRTPVDSGVGNGRRSEVVVTGGRDDRGTWELLAYESEAGLCVDLRFDDEGGDGGGGGGGCGYGVPEKWALSATVGGSPERQFVYGVVREDVAEVHVRLGSGTVLARRAIGHELGYGVGFFATAVPSADSAWSVVAFDAEAKAISRQEFFPDGGPPEDLEA